MADRFYKIDIRYSGFKNGYRIIGEIAEHERESRDIISSMKERVEIPLAVYQADLCEGNPQAKTKRYEGFYLTMYNTPANSLLAKTNAIFLPFYKNTQRLACYLKKGNQSSLDFIPYTNNPTSPEPLELWIRVKERYRLMRLSIVNEYNEIVYYNFHDRRNWDNPTISIREGSHIPPYNLEMRYGGRFNLLTLSQDRNGEFHKNSSPPDLFTPFSFSGRNKSGSSGYRGLFANVRSVPMNTEKYVEMVTTSIMGKTVVTPLVRLRSIGNGGYGGIGEKFRYNRDEGYSRYVNENVKGSVDSAKFIKGINFANRYARNSGNYPFGYSYLKRDYFAPAQYPKPWVVDSWGKLDPTLYQINQIHAYPCDLDFRDYLVDFPHLTNLQNSNGDMSEYKRKEPIREIKLRISSVSGEIMQDGRAVCNILEADRLDGGAEAKNAIDPVYNETYPLPMLAAVKFIDPKHTLTSRHYVEDMKWPVKGVNFNYGDNHMLVGVFMDPMLTRATARMGDEDKQYIGLIFRKEDTPEVELNPPTVPSKYGPALNGTKEYHPYKYKSKIIASYNKSEGLKFVQNNQLNGGPANPENMLNSVDWLPINRLKDPNQPSYEAIAMYTRDQLQNLVGMYVLGVGFSQETGLKIGLSSRRISAHPQDTDRTYCLYQTENNEDLPNAERAYAVLIGRKIGEWAEYLVDCGRASQHHNHTVLELALVSPDGKHFPIAIRDSMQTTHQSNNLWRLYNSENGTTSQLIVNTVHQREGQTINHPYKITISLKEYDNANRAQCVRIAIEQNNATANSPPEDKRKWGLYVRDRLGPGIVDMSAVAELIPEDTYKRS